MGFFGKVPFCTISSAHISHNDDHIQRFWCNVFKCTPFWAIWTLYFFFNISWCYFPKITLSRFIEIFSYFKCTRMIDIFIQGDINRIKVFINMRYLSYFDIYIFHCRIKEVTKFFWKTFVLKYYNILVKKVYLGAL